MICDNKTNFPHKLLLTNRQLSNLRKAFANYLATDIKFSKNQLGFKPPSKSVLISLGLTAAASAADAGIHKKILGSGTTALIMLNDEMEDIVHLVKYLEGSGLLLKGVSKTIQNEAKEQKGGSFSMFLVT